MTPPIVDKEQLISLFLRLASVDGVSLAERLIADEVSTILRAAGVHVIEDSTGRTVGGTAGNLFCFPSAFDPAKPSVVLTAHLDTVLPTAHLVPRVHSDRITSDGRSILGADNRAGLSALCYALLAIQGRHLAYRNFFVLFTIAEETGLVGAEHVDLSPYHVRSAFVFDCSRRPGVYIKECVGLAQFKAHIAGKSAHAGVAPDEGINAIAMASAGIAGLQLGRIDDDLTVNIGKISGGTAINVVPDKVEIEGEVRAFSPIRIREQLQLIERSLSQSLYQGGKLVFETREDFAPYVHAGDSSIIIELEDALKRVGLTPQPIRYTGGSDANRYNGKGIPAVNLGIGAQKPHSYEEFVLLEDLVKAAEIALALVQTR